MSNTNYIKGRRKEYQIMKILKQQGFDIAQRSAGSHSPIDVYAINQKLRLIKLIQCKPAAITEGEKNKILNSLYWLHGDFKVEFEII